MMLKTSVAAVLVAGLVPSGVMVSGASAAPAPARSAAAVEAQPEASDVNFEGRHGVRMLVRNHTAKTLHVQDRNNKGRVEPYLGPGELAVFYGHYTAAEDDLELAISVWEPHGQGGRVTRQVFDVDGSNPVFNAPSISVKHFPSGDYEIERYQSIEEGHNMSYGRIWVKRFHDDGDSNKQFDIDVKRLT